MLRKLVFRRRGYIAFLGLFPGNCWGLADDIFNTYDWFWSFLYIHCNLGLFPDAKVADGSSGLVFVFRLPAAGYSGSGFGRDRDLADIGNAVMPTLQEHIQNWAAAPEEQAKIDEDDARKLADQPQADDAGQNAWRRLEAAVLERSARRYRALAGGSGQRMIRAGGCRRLAAPVARLADRAGRSPCRAAGGVFGAGGGSRRGLTCAVGCANLRLELYSLHGLLQP